MYIWLLVVSDISTVLISEQMWLRSGWSHVNSRFQSLAPSWRWWEGAFSGVSPLFFEAGKLKVCDLSPLLPAWWWNSRRSCWRFCVSGFFQLKSIVCVLVFVSLSGAVYTPFVEVSLYQVVRISSENIEVVKRGERMGTGVNAQFPFSFAKPHQNRLLPF